MAEEALQAASDPDKLSFYGLSHWLAEVGKLLDRIAEHALEKRPNPEVQKLIDQKEDFLAAQSGLRRTMGSRLECPELTKRERPLAEDFLKRQITIFEKGIAAATGEPKKAIRAMEKLKEISVEVGRKKAALETREVQEIDAAIKAAEDEWVQVAPIYEKWEKGKHSFKTNEDLQAMRRRYEDARKTRESGATRLQRALCSSREGKPLALPVQDNSIRPGWFSAGKKPAAAATRPGAARAKKPAQTNSWGTAALSFAQRLRAEQVAQVRADAEDEDEEEDDDADEEEEPASAPPPVVRAKAAPALPKAKAAPVMDDGFATVKPGSAARPAPPPPPQRQAVEEEDDEDGQAEEARPSTYTASAKKKGKGGKTKKQKREEREEEEEDVPEPSSNATQQPSTATWVATAEKSISGSVVQELLQSGSWSLPKDEAAAEGRLATLVERLDWVTPLGFVMPLEWKEFASLEVDGGPKRTSRRGEPEWVGRVQQNIAFLLAHYVTLVFCMTLLDSLMGFGLLLLAVLLQAGLILAPPDTPYLRSPARVLLLQGAHLLLWLLFMRSLYQMNFFAKCFAIFLIGCHAYSVVPVRKED